MIEESSIVTRCVFGMAKSGLIIHGGTVRNLELDFLRLIYAVERTRAEGNDAVGYMCVLNARMRRSIDNWIERYQTADAVCVILPDLDDEHVAKLEAEKNRNREGNRQGANRENACANYGRDLAESALREHIRRIEMGVVESQRYSLGINWDFLGFISPSNRE